MNLDTMHKPAHRIREIAKNLALLIFTSFIFLLLLETAFRVRAYRMDRTLHQRRDIMLDKFYKWEATKHLNTDTLGPMFTPSSNDKIAFELRPDLIGNFAGAGIRTNHMGFRDDPYTYERPPGTIRVFGIGDSIMFGQGVRQEHNYLAVLEKELNRKHRGSIWEVINSGVPDYNTYIEVETLAEKGLKFSPSIVVLGFCSNDIVLPSLVSYMGMKGALEISDFLRTDISFLSMYIKHRLSPLLPDRPEIKNKYSSRGGYGSITYSMKRLYSLKQQYGFEVVVLFLTPKKGEVDDWFMLLARALNFHIVDMEEDIQSYMRQKGISDYYKSELAVPDKHPSEIVHRMTALKMLRYMEQSGLIKNIQ